MSTDEVLKKIGEAIKNGEPKCQIKRETSKNGQSVNSKIKDFACKNNVRI